jgi:hypothetical protein
MAEHRWQEGQSGNPAGSGDSPTQITVPDDESGIITYKDARKHLMGEIRRLLIEGGRAANIVLKAIEDAENGDWRARKFLWDYGAGPPGEVAATRGQANVQVNVVFDAPKEGQPVVEADIIDID